MTACVLVVGSLVCFGFCLKLSS
uniref:Uncharacterized protein n=1 Tax=Arundo donax TaxID=35708 RepID=A0A0A9GVE6_ARUDO